MTKRGGLGQNFFVGGFNVSGDIGVFDEISSPMEPLNATGVDKFARERIGGRRDGFIGFTSFFNDETGQIHDALSTLPTTDQIASLLFGTILGYPAALLNGKQAKYDGSRDEEGNLMFKSEILGNGFGIEWGHNLTGDGTDGVASQSSAGSLTGFDDGAGAATDFGLQMYVHLLSFTGTSITIKLQDSNDDDDVDPYADVTGATTAALTAAGGVRVQTSRTENVKEWLRVTTTGTFSAATFVVSAVRNLSTVVF